MIEKVQFRNFKAYRSLDLELEPFTVVVGPNASGKTTLLEGLQLATRAGFLGSLPGEANVPEREGMRSFGVSAPVEIAIEGHWRGTHGVVRIRSTPLSAFEPSQFMVSGKFGEHSFLKPDEPKSPGAEKGINLINYLPGFPSEQAFTFSAELHATTVLRLEPRKLARASYSENPVPVVDKDGTGLASVLAYLKLSQDEVFAEIEEALRQIVPAVRRVRIERAPVEQTAVRTIALDEQKHQVSENRTLWGNKIVLDMCGAKGVSAGSAGEGTLMVLGLLTVLMGPAKPRLLLLDDIELSLHPAAQVRLIEALRAIQKRDPELQIVATSHSPFILNYLDPKEVRMTFLAENGFARCEKLTAHPEFEKWKGLMAPGEFWSTVGEEWIGKLGGATTNE